MSPKSIGIIGGAGPLAGAFLLERLICLSSENYACYRDSDFPKIVVMSFPFSDMLSNNFDNQTVCKELSFCFRELRRQGLSILAIACNTLHTFLDNETNQEDLIHLPLAVAEKILSTDHPLVLCTSTSAKFGLHQKFFPCVYPDCKTQAEVDDIIELILKRTDQNLIIRKLHTLIRNQPANKIVLGCTELSLYASRLAFSDKMIVDPLEILAEKILKKSFSNKTNLSI